MKSVNAQVQPYNEGKMEGYQVAEQKWIDDGSTCSDAWKLEDNYDAYFIRGVYSNAPGENWEERLLGRGARDGVREFVAETQKECFEFPDVQCETLAWAAAKGIGRTLCPDTRYSATRGIAPKWTENCRLIAINICKGEMAEAVAAACPFSRAVTTRDILRLQRKCKREVSKLLNPGVRRRNQGRPSQQGGMRHLRGISNYKDTTHNKDTPNTGEGSSPSDIASRSTGKDEEEQDIRKITIDEPCNKEEFPLSFSECAANACDEACGSIVLPPCKARCYGNSRDGVLSCTVLSTGQNGGAGSGVDAWKVGC